MSNNFDPFRHHRKSIRYRDWDYRTPGYYFITICTHQRAHLFEHEPFQEVANIFWQRIPKQKSGAQVVVDESVIMPNHAHGILHLTDFPNGYEQLPHTTELRNALPGSIGSLVGAYKSKVSRAINNLRRTKGQPVWQRGYWDRIIRTEAELHNVRRYIRNNPIRWKQDRENLDVVLSRMVYHND